MTVMMHTSGTASLWMQRDLNDDEDGVDMPIGLLIDALVNFIIHMPSQPLTITIVLIGCMLSPTLVHDLFSRLPGS